MAPIRSISGSSLAAATVRTSGVLGVRLVVQAANIFVLAKLLGPAQLGVVVSLAALAIFMGNLATLGSHLTAMRDLSRAPGRRKEVLSAALGTTVLCGSGLLLFFTAVAAAFLDLGSGAFVPIVCIGAAELLVHPLLQISAADKASVGQVAGAQLLRMLPLPLQLVMATSIWLADSAHPLHSYSAGYLISASVALTISLKLLPGPWPSPRNWRLLRRGHLKDNCGFAIAAFTSSGPTELDKALAARLMTLEFAGIYAIASRIAIALAIPVSSMMLAVLPDIFRTSQREPPRRALLNGIFASGLLYGVAAGLALWFIAPLLERPLGAEFAELPGSIRWLSFSLPWLCLRLGATNILLSAGHPWVRAGIEIMGVSAMLACSMSLVPEGNLKGMALAVLYAEAAMAICGWLWIVMCVRKRNQ